MPAEVLTGLREEIERLFAEPPDVYEREHFAALRDASRRRSTGARSGPPSRTPPRRPAGGSTPGSSRGSSSASAWARSSTCRWAARPEPASPSSTRRPIRSRRLDRRVGGAGRAGRLLDPRRRLPGPGRHLHAADVHQRRRLGGRRHADRLPRPGGELRPGGQARPPLGRGPARRRAGAGRRLAGDRGGRRPDRRQLRRLRGDGRQAPRRPRRRHHPHPLDAGLRPGPGDDPPGRRTSCRW